MGLDVEIDSTLEQLATRLRDADRRANEALRGINVRAARDLLRVARTVVHVHSGRLRDSLHVEGPFDVATGVFEARVVSPVPYAEQEAEREDTPSRSHPEGGHNYPERTIEEGADIIEKAAEDMEAALVAILEGQA